MQQSARRALCGDAPFSFQVFVTTLVVVASPMAVAVVCDPPEKIGIEQRVDSGSDASIAWNGNEYGIAWIEQVEDLMDAEIVVQLQCQFPLRVRAPFPIEVRFNEKVRSPFTRVHLPGEMDTRRLIEKAYQVIIRTRGVAIQVEHRVERIGDLHDDDGGSLVHILAHDKLPGQNKGGAAEWRVGFRRQRPQI